MEAASASAFSLEEASFERRRGGVGGAPAASRWTVADCVSPVGLSIGLAAALLFEGERDDDLPILEQLSARNECGWDR